MLKLIDVRNFFLMRGEFHLDGFSESMALNGRSSLTETPSSTSSASVFISIFCGHLKMIENVSQYFEKNLHSLERSNEAADVAVLSTLSCPSTFAFVYPFPTTYNLRLNREPFLSQLMERKTKFE